MVFEYLKSKSHSNIHSIDSFNKTINIYEKLRRAQKTWDKAHCIPETS